MNLYVNTVVSIRIKFCDSFISSKRLPYQSKIITEQDNFYLSSVREIVKFTNFRMIILNPEKFVSFRNTKVLVKYGLKIKNESSLYRKFFNFIIFLSLLFA